MIVNYNVGFLESWKSHDVHSLLSFYSRLLFAALFVAGIVLTEAYRE